MRRFIPALLSFVASVVLMYVVCTTPDLGVGLVCLLMEIGAMVTTLITVYEAMENGQQ